jgi:hypothetical protein
MIERNNFIEREVFFKLVENLGRKDGGSYTEKSLATAYGDLSRLVVAWAAATSPKELQEIYNKFWGPGNAVMRPVHEAAKSWLASHGRAMHKRLYAGQSSI